MAFDWEELVRQMEAETLRARTMFLPGERYLRVEDYDPVLRAHCRLEDEAGVRPDGHGGFTRISHE